MWAYDYGRGGVHRVAPSALHRFVKLHFFGLPVSAVVFFLDRDFERERERERETEREGEVERVSSKR